MKPQGLVRSSLVIVALVVSAYHVDLSLANPIGQWDAMRPATAAMFATYPQVPYINPTMIYGGSQDPYSMASMQMPTQFFMQPQIPLAQSPMSPYDMMSSRRSQSSTKEKQSHHRQSRQFEPPTGEDEDGQKAGDDLPVSFLDPEPSSFSERISDSFSALGEGVRNHFKAMTENFSDTVDDIKDVWRSSDTEKKRLGR